MAGPLPCTVGIPNFDFRFSNRIGIETRAHVRPVAAALAVPFGAGSGSSALRHRECAGVSKGGRRVGGFCYLVVPV